LLREIGMKATLVTGALVIFVAGCTQTLVHDEVRRSIPAAAPCAGDEWADNSSLAAVPIPVVAFLSPHADLHKIQADNYLKRCGDTTMLVNRDVDVSRAACVPASVTRILTLGIYQWCPSHVSWRADVIGPKLHGDAEQPAS
jgi:hypothetical protein